ncbi:MAG: hypothetical protein M1817_002963 [Caeruleum heppii]|nr:MAG: hypothetical protein M1817_002963 [Caeruleum heppii]
MGNDGGSIPTRRELVKEAARNPNTTELKETRQEQQEWNWRNCPLSHRPLVRPIVSDCAGRLFNKDAILEALLSTDDVAKAADAEAVLGARVKSLKDVVEIRFTVEEDSSLTIAGETAKREEKWVCPITSKQLGPNVKSVYIVPCGHAFAEGAVREVAENTCLQCSEPYSTDHIIPILPVSPDDFGRLRTRMKSLREQGLTHSLKKASGSGKKRKKNDEAPATAIVPGSGEAAANGAEVAPKASTNPSTKSVSSTTGIKNASTASLTAKVLQDESERKKRQKLGMNDNLKSLFMAGGDKDRASKGGDFMSRGYTIPAHAKR